MRARTATIAAAIAMLVGCANSSPTPSQTDTDAQDRILKDPMGYKPEVGRDITGGDITHVGNGMDKDVNDVLNP